ncbi:hypothetical protein CDD82_2921 [Ophiocordyceps australis]|uniref:Velvet domain-containing protein n=1 Tax=Ophiocordyceps australis TaxID=1399860 RepID=A0A2C5XSI8_9HYPO|nr:hypothetical protein CDD82_2921 [Ophiocordyceps australis]
MAVTKISVQPPKRTQARTYLYPPVMAKQTVHDCEANVDYFATVVALDRHGNVMEGSLEGTKAASRFEIPGSKSNSVTPIFSFTDLSISYPGTFVIRVDVYKFSPGNYAGATLVQQLHSRPIAVYDNPVPYEGPTHEERSFMRKAQDAGIAFPAFR